MPSLTVVVPPSVHLVWWWVWRPAVRSHPSARQPLSRTRIARRWASVWSRRLRPRSRGLPVAAEDDGDDPRFESQAAGESGADLLPGVEEPGLLHPAQKRVLFDEDEEG